MAESPAGALEVAGHLSILAEGGPIDVAFRGDAIDVDVADLRTALAIRRRLPRSARRAWLLRLQSLLARGSLSLRLSIGGRVVGRLGAGSRPGRIASWLGLDPIEIDAREAFAVLARRRRRTPPHRPESHP